MKGGGETFDSLMNKLKEMAGNPEKIDVEFEDSDENKHNFSSTLFNASDYEIGIGLTFNGDNECIIIKQKEHKYGRGPEILRNFYSSYSDAGEANNTYKIQNPDTIAANPRFSTERATEAINLLYSITIDAGDEKPSTATNTLVGEYEERDGLYREHDIHDRKQRQKQKQTRLPPVYREYDPKHPAPTSEGRAKNDNYHAKLAEEYIKALEDKKGSANAVDEAWSEAVKQTTAKDSVSWRSDH
jgi:hypothetical protein